MAKYPTVDRIRRVGSIRPLAPGAKNRFVVAPDDMPGQSPFVLLVEDFIGAEAELDPHPHRGLETVTFILDGELEHEDHLGNSGVLRPGDVQWMTAGSGIVHGGKPHGPHAVHALQLWLNLPADLKMCAPGTREQRREASDERKFNGSTMRTYGARSVRGAAPTWSRWPMSLTDLELTAGAHVTLDVATKERMFVYLLSGELQVGPGGPILVAGDVAWFAPTNGADEETLNIPLHALQPARAVAYAGQPIAESIVARGPFVMNTEAEILEAYADLRANTFLERSRK